MAAADAEGAEATRRELVELEAAKPAAKPAVDPLAEKRTPPKIDPVVLQWTEDEGNWFKTNAVMRQFAIAFHGDLLQQNPSLSMEENLALTKAEVQKRFPEKFENPARKQAAAVSEPSTSGPRKSNGKTYADLPAEAKAACDRYVKTIPNYKREEYVKTYFAGEA